MARNIMAHKAVFIVDGDVVIIDGVDIKVLMMIAEKLSATGDLHRTFRHCDWCAEYDEEYVGTFYKGTYYPQHESEGYIMMPEPNTAQKSRVNSRFRKSITNELARDWYGTSWSRALSKKVARSERRANRLAIAEQLE